MDFGQGKIVPVNLEHEMKNSYIDYTQATTQTVDQSSRMAEAARTQQQPAQQHCQRGEHR